ncbi:MAG: DUF1636 family protein [bacterium]
MSHSVTICQTCAAGQALAAALADLPGYTVKTTDCMSGCTRPSTVAFRAPQKTAYLFGNLDLADLGDLTTFARLYAAAPDGNLADARPLGTLRTKAIARIPG